jgi:hypothetical protein
MTKTYNIEDLKNMDPAEVNVLLSKGKIEGKAVVKRADGSIKYDNPNAVGQYEEVNSNSHSEE